MIKREMVNNGTCERVTIASISVPTVFDCASVVSFMKLPQLSNSSPNQENENTNLMSLQELSNTFCGDFGKNLYSTFVKVSTDPKLANLLGVSSPMENLMPASIDLSPVESESADE